MTKLPWQQFETPNWRAVFNLFTRALEKQDIYTKGHSDRVEHLAILMGKALAKRDPSFWNHQLQYLKLAARFHDIGKIFVSKSTLNNVAALTKEQRDELVQHPEDGA